MSRRRTAAVGLQLRFSEQLRRKIEQAAKKRGCSMNTEIVDRLERTFDEEELALRLKSVIMEDIKASVKSAVSFIAKKEGE